MTSGGDVICCLIILPITLSVLLPLYAYPWGFTLQYFVAYT